MKKLIYNILIYYFFWRFRKITIVFNIRIHSNSVTHIALFEKIENKRIYFINSTQKDTNGDDINDIDGISYRDYPEDDSRFKAFGRMRVKY